MLQSLCVVVVVVVSGVVVVFGFVLVVVYAYVAYVCLYIHYQANKIQLNIDLTVF